MRLTFLGGTGTVTGSKYRVEHAGGSVLVDCGLFQGYKQLRLRNWSPLPIPASSFAAVVLTHAHLDHSGYLPLLVKQGFRGPVYCTEATCELCRILLPDSGRLLEEEADHANRYGYSKHRPALPQAPQVIATACPYCAVMMSDGVSALGRDNDIRVRDVAELVVEAMVRSKTAIAG